VKISKDNDDESEDVAGAGLIQRTEPVQK